MIKLGFIVSIAAVVTLNFKLCFSMTVCARAEYEVNGECCPMCAPGNHVYWHCTIDTSTTCVPCPPSTYTDEPNGFDKCFPCSVCDTGQGLRVKRSCTRFADTVCEPLEGFYCIEQNKGSCRFAVKHSECHPGQYIRQAGTAFTDTDCGNCPEGTYSNGSFTTCQPHSKCETEGLTEIKPGTVSSDAECGSSAPIGIIAGVTTGVVLLSVGISLIYFKFKHKKQSNENVHCTLLGFGKACGPSEYKSDVGECCPMCNIGSVVRTDCTGDLSTTCQPCAPGTFISEPNGLHSCFTCKNCDESQGLYIQSKCTTIRDTICDVLDGYYCTDYSNSQCSRAVKHSVCKPGQETNTPGTKTSDTVCVDCTSGYFSPSGLNCTKWTDCTARNEIKTENGSFVKDVTCTQRTNGRGRYGLIFAVVLTFFFIILLLIRAQYPPEKTFSANRPTLIAQPTGEV